MPASSKLLRVLAGALAAVSVAILAACAAAGGHADPFTLTVYAPRYASGFRILGAEGRQSVVLRVDNPWQGAEGVSRRLLILRGGESAPEGFDGQVIKGDARRVVVMSSSHIAMLDAVGAARAVAGVSGLRFVTNKHILARRSQVGDVGYDGNIDYERLVALNPDLVLLYGVNSASAMESKLASLAIPYIYIGEYVEDDPIGKAEWTVAVAETVGKRAVAERVVSGIAARYKALRQRVAAAKVHSPAVMLNTPYRDQWFLPAASSYTVRLITDAGGRTVWSPDTTTTASQAVDIEQAYQLASGADVWIGVSGVASMAELKAQWPKFADTKPVVSGRVYATTLRGTRGGGNDFWESGAIRPDLVLADFVKIIHPELARDIEFTYYGRLPD